MTFYADWKNASPTASGAPHQGNARTATTVAPPLFVLGAALGLGMAVLLLGVGAQAQMPAPAPAQVAAASATPSEPKYTVAQIAQAFSFIDSNRDGKLSREESAGFRGVARHFDEADVNKDGVLSREEFESALSSTKPR